MRRIRSFGSWTRSSQRAMRVGRVAPRASNAAAASAGMAPEKVAEIMRQEFLLQAGPALQGKLHPLLTPEKAVILASIVEREAVLAEEKPLIARVYLNRLEKRWPLEADPTVQFAMGYWKKRLIYKDLEFPSDYNTYKHRGLPPGPICSPGLGSIMGVVQPAVSEAMYFVADNTGGHTFAKTFQEHQKAKDKMQAERRVWRRRHSVLPRGTTSQAGPSL